MIEKYNNSSPLASLEGNRYNIQNYTYPENLELLSHAMIFNINVQERSPDSKAGVNTALSRSQELRQGTIQGRGITTAQAEERLPGTVATSQKAEELTGQKFDKITLNRKTKRSTTAIALYVPETLVHTNAQQYEEVSLTSSLAAAGKTLIDAASLGLLSGLTNSIGEGFNSTIQPGGVGNLITYGTGFAINPILEVIYTQPNLRQFQFDFMFAPRSETEAQNVDKIIKEFRAHQAPEFFGDTLKGLFFIPPSEFDITFLRNSGSGFTENDKLPKISTCVLENIDVNYAPQNQYTTFRDGMPTHIQMILRLRELDIMTRDRIRLGY